MDWKIILYFNQLFIILSLLRIINLGRRNLNLLVDQFSNPKFRVKFNGICLKTDEKGFNFKKINLLYCFWNKIMARNSLFWGVKLTKNSNKYCYSGYGISFDVRRTFSLPNGEFGKSVIIIGAEMSLFVQVNEVKDILILGKGPTQGFEDTTWIAEAEYFTNFIEVGRKILFKSTLKQKQQLFKDVSIQRERF